MTTGQKIRAYRKASGLTAKTFAEKIGYSESTIYEWEGNTRPPLSIHTYMAIAKGLGVPVMAIIDDDYMEDFLGWKTK